MKKTLIALLALGGLSMAASIEDATAVITMSSPSITGQTYNTANMYIVANLNLDAAKSLTSTTNDSIVGMTLSSNVDRIAAGIKGNQFKFTTDEEGTQIGNNMWTPKNYPASSNVEDVVNALKVTDKKAEAITLTLAYSTTVGLGSSMLVSVLYDDGSFKDFTYQHDGVRWANTTITGAAIDTNYVETAYLFNNESTAWTADMIKETAHNVLKSSVVPEPATGALSLLALAGLSARRRRK